MSFHILHVLRHGVVLSKERGFLSMKEDGVPIKRMPLEDLRAIIIAARGVTLTSSFISGALSEGVVILHCDEHYRPCGLSSPCSRIVDPRAALAQGNSSSKLHSRLWRHILRWKIRNQCSVLKLFGTDHTGLSRISNSPAPDESRAARLYWKAFFPSLGEKSTRRRIDDTPLNRYLNYGYAVASALCHRSIVAHGLNPLFGIHHIPRYQAHAFVYDLVEPLRPFVDALLVNFIRKDGKEMKDWCKAVSKGFLAIKVNYRGSQLKLLDGIDRYVSSVAACYAERTIKKLWVPEYDGEFDQDGLAIGNV